MLFPVTLQSAAQAAIAHKETLIIDVLAKLDIIKDGEPYDMAAISQRCRFVVHADDKLGYPKGTQVFEVDGVPKLVIYPHAIEEVAFHDVYQGEVAYRIEQRHKFL